MSIWVSPLPESLPVAPGAAVTCAVTVRNDSEIVDEYSVEVLGDAGAWSQVEPKRLSLMPGTIGEVTITVSPPVDSELQPGVRPLGLKVASVERPATSAVVEGTLEILGFGDYGFDLIPRTSHGSGSGTHEVAFDNRGNRHVQVGLTASDPDGVLRFRFNPPVLDAPPGSATFAKVQVKHRRRFLRGPAKMRPFVVTAEPEGDAPLTANGTAVQTAALPTWVLGLLIGLAMLALLWTFVLQPNVEDVARNEATKQTAKILSPATTAKTDTNPSGASGAGSGGGQSGGGGGTSGGGTSGGGGGGTNGGGGSGSGTGSGGTGSNTGGDPDASNPAFSKRLAPACKGICAAGFTVPAGKTFSVTDIILGNPRNTKGTLTIRNGTAIITVENLDNFRDLDFHFGTPVKVRGTKSLSVSLRCGGVPCSAAAFFSGTLG